MFGDSQAPGKADLLARLFIIYQVNFHKTLCYRYDAENVRSVLSSGRTSVNVWGFISRHGLGPLQRIHGTLTSAKYCRSLDDVLLPYIENLFPDRNFLFQHDQAPVHMGRIVKQYISEKQIPVLEWCPKGADLNIIENVWRRLKAATAKKPLHATTADVLWEEVRQQWECLRADQSLVPALYASLPSRMAAVVAGNGEMTRY